MKHTWKWTNSAKEEFSINLWWMNEQMTHWVSRVFNSFDFFLITSNKSNKIWIHAVSWADIKEFLSSWRSLSVLTPLNWLFVLGSVRTLKWFSSMKKSIWFLLARRHSFKMYKRTSKIGPQLDLNFTLTILNKSVNDRMLKKTYV